ncbi:MAG TPA: hypothetical protein VHM90_12700 [Phycisphaerae bacterium]|nr:hypothetical protein [Phycisphaerae bacterium]
MKQPQKSKSREEPWFRVWRKAYFVAAHIAIPYIALQILVLCVCYDVVLSWQLLIVVGLVLLPFILPLIGGYVKETNWFKMRGDPFDEPGDEGVQDQANPPPIAPITVNAAPMHNPPAFDTLQPDEKSVLKTLWVHQIQHTIGKGLGWWGFSVPADSDTYSNFQAGVAALRARELVTQNEGTKLVFLNDAGLKFCSDHEAKLKAVSNYWKVFRPA